jgi:phage-related protein
VDKPTFDRITRPDGTSEFDDFLDSLPLKDRAKLLAVIDNTEELGIEKAVKMKWVKKLEGGICELRSKQGSDIQRALNFHEIDNKYMITHGFTKKTDKTPRREIEHSIRMKKEYSERRKEE